MSQLILKEPNEAAPNWQAQKSAMTRDSILDATISGFIKLGYNKLTTTKVADMAGISRGAMRYHFASKKELIQSAIIHLHKKMLNGYVKNISLIPDSLAGRALIRARVDAYWNYLNSDLYLVYQELCSSARTEPELKEPLDDVIKDFDESGRQSALSLFPEWDETNSSQLFFIIDTTRFTLEGLARLQWQISIDRDVLVERQLEYLAFCIEQIVNDDGNTELSKFFS
ncbi:TetR/AcrR family transcriptional regulator [Oceanicoccus sp. KOV_DT_Chl]|uniref:TetR/AcrR family transcriptional regulator n=1 Tax=Oceanicoccus sp. KOV_DT_Chl TaxID=1904639 RepID=UPI000C7C33D4|nr:TetR/AcrR family transcriptional regulator [Oceanicoccus sp. KOV_DT_Chl]